MRVEVADRSIVAPLYVEPGLDGDLMGVEGRHRHNMEKMFGFMGVVAQVLNNHAECIDNEHYEGCLVSRSVREQTAEVKAVKAGITTAEQELKDVTGIIQANDEKLKEDFAASIAKVWEFMSQNNCGIMGLFQEAGAAVKQVKLQMEATQKHVEEAKAAESAKPSEVAAGPKGLAFVGLRADMRKLHATVRT